MVLTDATAGTSLAQRSAVGTDFFELQRKLAGTGHRLAFAARRDNDAVAALNRLIMMRWMFPATTAGV